MALQSGKTLKLDRSIIFSIFFLGILIFLLYQLLLILSPFASALILSVILTLIFYPVHVWVKKNISKNKNSSAAISTFIVFLTVILPLILFGWLLFNETKSIYPKTNAWISLIPKTQIFNTNNGKFKQYLNIDLKKVIVNNIESIQGKIVHLGGKIIKNTIFIIIDLVVVMFTLFFFFRDGKKWLSWLLDMAPMEHEHKRKIATHLYKTILAIVKGFILTAAVQGIIATIGYYIAKVPSPVLMGLLTFGAAFIPFGGTTLVWLPIAIIIFISKSHAAGIFLAIWGTLLISSTDNILRPILIGRDTKLPIVLLFLGIFGGLRIYGAIGLFLGPLLVSCLIVFLEIYQKETLILPASNIAKNEGNEHLSNI